MIYLSEHGISLGNYYARIADTEDKELDIIFFEKTEEEAIKKAKLKIKELNNGSNRNN